MVYAASVWPTFRQDTPMLNRLFPNQFDNNYRGHWLAPWLLGIVMAAKAMQGVQSIINTRDVLTTADGIALDRFNSASVEVVIALFALLGLYLLVLPLQSIVVLLRYRTMVPLMYLLLLLVNLASRVLALVNPIARPAGHPIGYYVNLAILVVTLLGFVLSLLGKPEASAA